MDAGLFWTGVLPVIVFVLADAFTTKKNAIYSAIAFSVFECLFTLYKYHTIDELTVFSFALVAFFGWLSVKKNNDIYFKLQPALLGLFFALTFFFFYFVLDKPLFNFMMDKYFSGQADTFLRRGWTREAMDQYMRILSRDLGWWLLAHAAATAYAAIRMSKWWWFFFRVPAFYMTLIVAGWVEVQLL